MTIDMQDMLNSILDSLERIEYIRPEDIPNIDLYMDQVTTFMDNKLRRTARNPGDDKILTKTMINHDIQVLFAPITDKFFKGDGDFSLEQIYDEVFGLEKEHVQSLKEDVIEKFRQSGETFGEGPKDSEEFLKLFSFICMLSFDVYVKKLIIEKLIDGMKTDKK